jgi:predicted amidohydrolase YtcJ
MQSREGGMVDQHVPRRDVLTGAVVAMAAGIAGGRSSPAGAQPAAPATRPVDLVFRNGKVITVDGRSSVAQAIAITGDRIAAVGPDDAMTAHIAPGTRVIDLKGRSVTPGLIDGHAHMDREALRAVFPSLGHVRSIKDIQDRIAQLARDKQPGEWIVTMPIGDPPFYFDVPDILAEKRWPTRQELDEAAPNNPVYIRSIWGFWRGTQPLVSIANTEALKRAGITRDTASPVETLIIVKDDSGDPTGVFVEREFAPVAELVWFRDATRFSHADRVRALGHSASLYHSYGTTSIYEGHGVAGELLKVYKDVHASGALLMRSTLAISPDWKAIRGVPAGSLHDAWAGWLGEVGAGDDWLKISGLFCAAGRSAADNVRGAAAPYTGWAGFNSDAGLPRDLLKHVLLQCAKSDIRVATIAGAAGLGMLDVFEEVDREVPLKGRRWVMSHLYVAGARDIERIARMGLVITTHTNATLYKALDAIAGRLPPERHDDITPLNALREAGVTVSLATDNVPISLWHPVAQTVARRAFTSQRVFGPSQALSRMEALRCATMNGAYLTFDEGKKGSLETGKFADLAVLSADPLTVGEKELAEITSVMTLVGGKRVYEAPGWND